MLRACWVTISQIYQINATAALNFAFSEFVTGFDQSDISYSGCEVLEVLASVPGMCSPHRTTRPLPKRTVTLDTQATVDYTCPYSKRPLKPSTPLIGLT